MAKPKKAYHKCGGGFRIYDSYQLLVESNEKI